MARKYTNTNGVVNPLPVASLLVVVVFFHRSFEKFNTILIPIREEVYLALCLAL